MTLVPVKKRERGRGELTRLHEEMDDLFKSFFEPWAAPVWGHHHWPAIDIGETDDAFIVKADVPGCKAEDIEISVHGNMLNISGEKKHETQEKEKAYYHIERSYGSFRRELNLASDVDPEKIKATCKDGVLSIRLPKTEKTRPIKVEVKEL
jgi:HSP20 family protein